MRHYAVIATIALSACVQTPNPAVESIRTARELGKLARESQQAQANMTKDALPSAEVIAFQKTDARLHYGNAHIVSGDGGCAFYQGTTADGQVARVPLTDADNKPICRR